MLESWNLVNRCVLLMEEEESVVHLFIHCSVAYRVEFFLFMPSNFTDLP